MNSNVLWTQWLRTAVILHQKDQQLEKLMRTHGNLFRFSHENSDQSVDQDFAGQYRRLSHCRTRPRHRQSMCRSQYISPIRTKEGRRDEAASGVKQWRAACVMKYWVVGTMARTAGPCFTPETVSSRLFSFVYDFHDHETGHSPLQGKGILITYWLMGVAV